LAGRPANPSPLRSVPDYKPNPAFSGTSAKKEEQEDAAEKEKLSGHAHKMSGVYEVRPPPPPPSVPTHI
jgi:hypothetical protein